MSSTACVSAEAMEASSANDTTLIAFFVIALALAKAGVLEGCLRFRIENPVPDGLCFRIVRGTI
jgi:hypothetical protein